MLVLVAYHILARGWWQLTWRDVGNSWQLSRSGDIRCKLLYHMQAAWWDINWL